MTQWIRDFADGAACVWRGCRAFHRDRAVLWQYAVLPMLILLGVYALLFWGIFAVTGLVMERVVAQITELLAWCGNTQWLANGVAWLIRGVVMVASLFLAAVSLSTLYEVFGGVFFDAMIDKFESRNYGTTAPEISFRQNIRFLLESIFYGLRNFVILLVLLLLSLLTVAGVILPPLIMGYLLGVSYMISSANRNGMGLKELRYLSRKRRALVLGYGVTAYLLLMIPFLAVFFLPGLVLGGSVLFNEKLTGTAPDHA